MPVLPCVQPVTVTDELLAQVVGLLGDVLDKLPGQPAQNPALIQEPAVTSHRTRTRGKEPDV